LLQNSPKALYRLMERGQSSVSRSGETLTEIPLPMDSSEDLFVILRVDFPFFEIASSPFEERSFCDRKSPPYLSLLNLGPLS